MGRLGHRRIAAVITAAAVCASGLSAAPAASAAEQAAVAAPSPAPLSALGTSARTEDAVAAMSGTGSDVVIHEPSRGADVSVSQGPGAAGSFDPSRATLDLDRSDGPTLVYRRPDGGSEAVVGQLPQVVDTAAGKQLVDLDLVPVVGASGVFHAAASAVDARIASAAATRHGGPLVSIEIGKGETIDVQIDGMAAVDGTVVNASTSSPSNAVHFADALPNGVDIDASATPTGSEWTYVVPSLKAASGPRVERLSLPSGWSARQKGSAVELLDASGKGAAMWSAPSASDAAGAMTPASVTLSSSGGGVATASVDVDSRWLADPARVWPIRIDPVVTQNLSTLPNASYWVDSANPANPGTDNQFFRVGRQGSTYPESVKRSVIGWEELLSEGAGFAGATVNSATLRLRAVNFPDGQSHVAELQVRQNTSWSIGQSWWDRPTVGTLVASSGQILMGNGPVDIDVTTFVRDWLSGGNPYPSVTLSAGNESDPSLFMTIPWATDNNFSAPQLIIDYTTVTSNQPPTAVYDAGLPTLDFTATAPQIAAWSGSDPEGDPVEVRYQLFSMSGLRRHDEWDSGWMSGNWTLPFALPAGRAYRLRILIRDNYVCPSTGLKCHVTIATWNPFHLGYGWFDLVTPSFVAGIGPASRGDTIGPITTDVNSGNAIVTVPGRSLATVGGVVSMSLTYSSMTPAWSVNPSPVLPLGWALAADGGVGYIAAQRRNGSVSLLGTDGREHIYVADGDTQSYLAPRDEDGILAVQADDTLQLSTSDGIVYTFDSTGRLTSAVSSVDTVSANALATYTWSGSPTRLTTVADPVSARSVTLRYGGDALCPTWGSGATPSGMLCRIDYWDGATTNLYYYGDGRLGRVGDSGGENWDFAYNAAGRMSKLRDPLAADAVAAGVRADDDTTRWLIDYSTAAPPCCTQVQRPRVTAVTGPIPLAGGTSFDQPVHTYEYSSSGVPLTFTKVHVLDRYNGSTPNYADTVYNYNADNRISSIGLPMTGKTTTIFYRKDPANHDTDLVAATSDEMNNRASRITTMVYDNGSTPRLTDTYGPWTRYAATFVGANECFALNGTDADSGYMRPVLFPDPGCDATNIPHSQPEYDGNINGLGAAWWSNTNMSGLATNRAVINGSLTASAVNGATPAPPTGAGWSARFTGDIIPTGGTVARLQLTLTANNNARVYVGNQLVIDGWNAAPGTYTGSWFVPPAGPGDPTPLNYNLVPAAIRVDYKHTGAGTADFALNWMPNATGSFVTVPAGNLQPRFNRVTKTTVLDPIAGNVVTGTGFANLADGAPTTDINDPTGLALTTTTGYETAAVGHYRRRVSRTLPAGNAWTYAYYGADANPSTAVDPCAGGTAVQQGGALWKTTGPDPDGAGPAIARVDEFVYDAAGRVVGSRVGTESWTCASYDARGRVSSRTYPAFGGSPGRTVTYNWAVGGNPLVSSVTDPTGTITTTVDLLGRTVAYTDVWGKTTTTTYDVRSRVGATSGPQGNIAQTYYYDARPATQTVDGASASAASYGDNFGQAEDLTTVQYSTGPQTFTYDYAGRKTGALYGGNQDTVTRSQSGRIVDESTDGVDPYPSGANYVYDGGGRVTTARVAGHTLQYAFAASGGCGALTAAGKNTNRTTLTDNSVTTATYCYDSADRLTSTTAAGYTGSIVYDAHGNTTTIGGDVHGYDAADRHISTDAPTKSVRYQRDALDRIVSRTVADPPTYSTIAQHGSSSTHNGSGSNSLSINKPSGTTTGDVMLAQISVRGGTGTTITPPLGWSLVNQTSSGTTLRAAIYQKVATSTENGPYVFSFSSSQKASGGVAAYGGVDSALPVAAGQANPSGTSHSTPSVNVAVANSELVGFWSLASGSTGSNFSNVTTPMFEEWDVASTSNGASSRTASMMADQVIAAGASNTRSATSSASAVSVTQAVVLAPQANVSPGTTTRYSFTDDGDSPGATLDASNNVIERTIRLIGGGMLNITGSTWRPSLPNVHGDIMIVPGDATRAYDPYGNSVVGTTPDNSAGEFDYGWLGGPRRPLEHQGGLQPTIEMGARQYNPALGRFLQADPVEGGSANDYEYADGDPVNNVDLDGRCVDPVSGTICAEGVVAGGLLLLGLVGISVRHPHVHISLPHIHLFGKRKGDTTRSQRDRIRERAGNRCEDCGRETQRPRRLGKGDTVPGDRSEIHHETPLGQGGTSEDDNLSNLCHECHWQRHGW